MEILEAQHTLTNTTATLAEQMAEILNTPPCKGGIRLKSETELANFFDTSLRQVRTALEDLERQGIVIRKKGSGTYLRRKPRNNEDTGKTPNASSLLAATQNNSLNKKILSSVKAKKHLKVELWSCLHNTTFCNQIILNSITQEFSRSNHWLSLHTSYEGRTSDGPKKDLGSYLKQHPCDGYIVSALWADYFLQHAQGLDKPIVFFHPGSLERTKLQPIINLGSSEAITLATNIFMEDGFSKIALFAIHGKNHYHKNEIDSYCHAISRAGLDYSKYILSSDSDLNATIEQTIELVESPERPEAIYIADNFLTIGVYQGLKIAGLTPGKDIAVITHNNAGTVLPGDINWSCLEFSLEEFGRLITTELLRKIENPSAALSSQGLYAKWIEGDTHTISS